MKIRIFAVGALAMAALPSFATDLWNQEAPFHTNGGNGIIDAQFSDITTYSTYDVDDVIVTGGTWNVTSIQTEIIAGGTATQVEGITQAILNVFVGGASLPTAGNNPTLGTPVTVTVTPDTNFTNVYYLTATGLNLNWAPGEYWVGLTAESTFATNGATYMGYTDPAVNNAGANHTSAIINPGNGYADGTSWGGYTILGGPINSYGAIDIQGSVVAAPEPVSIAFLGLGVVGLIARRRNRS